MSEDPKYKDINVNDLNIYFGTMDIMDKVLPYKSCKQCITGINPFTGEFASITTDTFIAYFLGRFPFFIPVVWLAIYAGRRHGQALRLEEEYANKETISNAFEGYKNQIGELEEKLNDTDRKSTLKLIDRTLEAVSLHPGRIYEGRHDDISPWQSISNIIRTKKDSDKSS